MKNLAAALIGAWMRWDMRRSFDRVVWHGAWPPALPQGRPLIICANHHHFYDAHLVWYVLRMLERPGLVWMQEWRRFPIFAPVGALPFPADDPRTRASTVRRTARYFQKQPNTGLVYFPSGTLQTPEVGIGPYPEERFTRLHRLYPTTQFWPMALHITWDGGPYPVARMRGGTVFDLNHTEPGCIETELRALWTQLRETTDPNTHLLMRGRPSPADRWNLAWMAPLFKRLL